MKPTILFLLLITKTLSSFTEATFPLEIKNSETLKLCSQALHPNHFYFGGTSTDSKKGVVIDLLLTAKNSTSTIESILYSYSEGAWSFKQASAKICISSGKGKIVLHKCDPIKPIQIFSFTENVMIRNPQLITGKSLVVFFSSSTELIARTIDIFSLKIKEHKENPETGASTPKIYHTFHPSSSPYILLPYKSTSLLSFDYTSPSYQTGILNGGAVDFTELLGVAPGRDPKTVIYTGNVDSVFEGNYQDKQILKQVSLSMTAVKNLINIEVVLESDLVVLQDPVAKLLLVLDIEKGTVLGSHTAIEDPSFSFCFNQITNYISEAEKSKFSIYKFEPSECKVENCESCGFSENFCSDCKQNFKRHNGICIENCPLQTFFDSKFKFCKKHSCPPGSFFSGFQCLKCLSGCKTCTSATICYECEENFELIRKMCYQNNIEGYGVDADLAAAQKTLLKQCKRKDCKNCAKNYKRCQDEISPPILLNFISIAQKFLFPVLETAAALLPLISYKIDTSFETTIFYLNLLPVLRLFNINLGEVVEKKFHAITGSIGLEEEKVEKKSKLANGTKILYKVPVSLLWPILLRYFLYLGVWVSRFGRLVAYMRLKKGKSTKRMFSIIYQSKKIHYLIFKCNFMYLILYGISSFLYSDSSDLAGKARQIWTGCIATLALFDAIYFMLRSSRIDRWILELENKQEGKDIFEKEEDQSFAIGEAFDRNLEREPNSLKTCLYLIEFNESLAVERKREVKTKPKDVIAFKLMSHFRYVVISMGILLAMISNSKEYIYRHLLLFLVFLFADIFISIYGLIRKMYRSWFLGAEHVIRTIFVSSFVVLLLLANEQDNGIDKLEFWIGGALYIYSITLNLVFVGKLVRSVVVTIHNFKNDKSKKKLVFYKENFGSMKFELSNFNDKKLLSDPAEATIGKKKKILVEDEKIDAWDFEDNGNNFEEKNDEKGKNEKYEDFDEKKKKRSLQRKKTKN